MLLDKANILLVFTGGTINMKLTKDLETTIDPNFANELMEVVGKVFPNINFQSTMFGGFPSPHMTPTMMLELSKMIERKVASENFDGVVVIHGTDTLEETAFFLDTYFDIEIPIIVHGAMRNGSEIGYDGWSNLQSSIRTILSPTSKSRGVLVVMNDQINAAIEVTKTHTMALDTFRSLEFGPIGVIENNAVFYYREPIRKTQNYKPIEINKKVALIKATTGMDSDIIDFYLHKKYDGIVIEAFGRGNVPPNMVFGIEKAIKANIPVWITSRCPMGRVAPLYSYEGGGMHLVKIGAKLLPSISSHKARLLLLMKLSTEQNKK